MQQSKNIFIYLFCILLINVLIKHLLLSKFGFPDRVVSEIILKTIFITITIYLILKFNLFRKKFITSNLVMTILFFLFLFFISINYVTKISSEFEITFHKNFLFIVNTLLTGIFEELLFRLFLFVGIYKYLFNFEYDNLVKTIIVTSLIFGLAHISNFFNQDYDKSSVIVQIIFAFGIGIFFQSLFIYSKNILIPIILHFVVNYLGMYKSKLINHEVLTTSEYTLSDFFTSTAIMLLILILVITPLCTILIKKRITWHNIVYKK